MAMAHSLELHRACHTYVQLATASDQLSRACRCSWQATQAAKEVAGSPYKTLLSRQYRPQLIITILVSRLAGLTA